MRQKLEKILPAYAWLPLAAVLLMNFCTYFISRLITTRRPHVSMWTAVDDHIPFLNGFVLIYLLAFLQWAVGFLLIGRESREICRVFYRGEIIAKGICLICFLAVPTTIARPQISGNGFLDLLTGMIYRMDAPDNLFPSIHCLESWVCFRSARYLKKVPSWYGPFSLLFSLLVFASTVCIKQHVFVDIPAAILAVEIGLWISRLIERKTSRTSGSNNCLRGQAEG